MAVIQHLQHLQTGVRRLLPQQTSVSMHTGTLTLWHNADICCDLLSVNGDQCLCLQRGHLLSAEPLYRQ